MEASSPRVNKAALPKFVGRTVSLVGKLTAADGPVMTLHASDSQPVVVHVGSAAIPQATYLEVIGRVRPDSSVEAAKIIPFGDSLDLEAYNELVELSLGKFAALFT